MFDKKTRFFAVVRNKETQRNEIKEIAFQSIVLDLSSELSYKKPEIFAVAWMRVRMAGVGSVLWCNDKKGRKEFTGKNGVYEPLNISQIFCCEEDAVSFCTNNEKDLSFCKESCCSVSKSYIDLSEVVEDIRKDLTDAVPSFGMLRKKSDKCGGLYDTEIWRDKEVIMNKALCMKTFVWDGGKAIVEMIATKRSDVPSEELDGVEYDFFSLLLYDVISKTYFINHQKYEKRGYSSKSACEQANQIEIEYFA